MRLRDKVVAISGAAQGLGQAYAVACAREGAKIVAFDRDACDETAARVAEAGGEALARAADVTDMGALAGLAEETQTRFGRIDGLVNNAALYGALTGGRFDQIDEAAWNACMDVNVTGVWNAIRAFGPAMRGQGGSIVNIASLAAIYGLPYALHYTTSKAAVIGLTRGLARELGHDAVRVNAIAPSAVLTPGTDQFFGDKREKALDVIAKGQALQRNLETTDLTGAVIYLLSDESAMITGQTLSVDGGTVLL